MTPKSSLNGRLSGPQPPHSQNRFQLNLICFFFVSTPLLVIAELNHQGRLSKESFLKHYSITADQLLYYAKSCENTTSQAIIKWWNEDTTWKESSAFAYMRKPHEAMENYRAAINIGVAHKKNMFENQTLECGKALLVKPYFIGREGTGPAAEKISTALKTIGSMLFEICVQGQAVPADAQQTLRSLGSKVPFMLLDSCNALSLAFEKSFPDDPFKPDKSRSKAKAAARTAAAIKKRSAGEAQLRERNGLEDDDEDEGVAIICSSNGMTEEKWTKIKQQNDWDPAAPYWEGREIPTAKGDMRKSQSGRKSSNGSGDQNEVGMMPKIPQKAARISMGKTDAAAAADQAALVAQKEDLIVRLQNDILEYEARVEAKQRLIDATEQLYQDLKSDFEQAKAYGGSREELHQLAHKSAHVEATMLWTIAKNTVDTLERPENHGQGIEGYNFKWTI